MLSIDLLAFLLSSVISLVLIYFQVSTAILQQSIAFLLIILLFISNKFLSSKSALSNALFKFITLFLSSLFVQILILSSGGFYSPFLILLHLYTLGSSFLLKLSSAISFLVLSVVVLVAATFLNQTLLAIFQQDPGSIILYLISFLVIIPVAQYVMRTYHLKDTISKLLTEHIQLGEKREQSILQGLSELVLVTDMNFKILSVNGAAERMLGFEYSLIGKDLLDVLELKNDQGLPATAKSLSVDEIFKDKLTHIVEGLYLGTKGGRPIKVTIQVKPITNPNGSINQIAFVITDAVAVGKGTHFDLEVVRKKQALLFERLTKNLKAMKLPDVEKQAILFKKIEEDVSAVTELEDHPFKKITTYQDIAALCQQIIQKKQELANLFGINISLDFGKGDRGEEALLSLKRGNISGSNLPISDFAVPTDPRWLSMILERLLDICILIYNMPSNMEKSAIKLSINKTSVIEVLIAVQVQKIDQNKLQDIFQEYFGALISMGNLRLGSGLEGFIAKTIAFELNIPLKVISTGTDLVFQLQLTKQIV